MTAAPEVLALLKALVAVDSTSTRSNLPILDVVEERLRPLGFATRRMVWRDAAGVEKANLIARRGPDTPGGLALVGHSDCVPFDPDWKDALKPRQEEGRLYGRGTADTKSFIAAAIAASAQAKGGAQPLHLVLTADEELGCLGAKRLVEEGKLHPRVAIIGEPTRLTPVRAHKGYCLAEVEVTGAEGHSAYPETGASAIFAAGRLLEEVERVERELAGNIDAQFSPPHTTFNVGLITGGKAKNVIPGACRFTLEWRPIPGQEVTEALERFQVAAARVVSERGGKIAVKITPSRLDTGVSIPPGAEVVRFLEQASGRKAETIPFGTELPQLTALGAEACVFGPGDIRTAHRTGEFVPIAELESATAILGQAIERFTA
jgi:acetylornithine deacetylase